MAISLLFSANTSAIEFSFNSPEKIKVDEEFEITINLDDKETYDVKAFVHDDNREYSEIFSEGSWENPYFYLKGVFPGQKTFKLIAHKALETKVCVKLRKSSSKAPAGEVCNNIIVEDNPGNSAQNNNQQTQNNQSMQVRSNEPKNQAEGENQIEQVQDNLNKAPEKDKIVLEYDEGENEKEDFMTKQEKVRLGVLYSFAGVAVLIIILLALKKL